MHPPGRLHGQPAHVAAAQVSSHVAIPFSKQTLYRAMIVRSTLDGCREAHAAMLAAAARALAAGGAAGCPPRPAPGSPRTTLCFQGGAASADNSADGSSAALCTKPDAEAPPGGGGGGGARGAPKSAQGALGGPAECVRHAPQGGPLGVQTPARAARVAGRVRGDPGTPRGEGWEPARTPRTHRRQRSRHAAPSPGCAALPNVHGMS